MYFLNTPVRNTAYIALYLPFNHFCYISNEQAGVSYHVQGSLQVDF